MERGKRRKADCTPEEWQEHLAKVRAYREENHERYLAKQREYIRRPETIAKRKAAYADPAARAAKSAYRKTPEAKAFAKARYAKRKDDQAFLDARNAVSRKRRTGFTAAMVKTLQKHQGNKCAICERTFEGRRMCADHCHSTNEPRGLLCHECNVVEGIFRKLGICPKSFGEKLIHYLSAPPASEALSSN